MKVFGLLNLRDEKGLYYALDLGGTNFRVLRIQLAGKGGHIVNQEFVEASIPQSLMLKNTEVSIFPNIWCYHPIFF